MDPVFKVSPPRILLALILISFLVVAVGVIPLLVVAGWAIGEPLTLFFQNLDTIALFLSVFLVNVLIQDGKSNYMEGTMLVALYAIVALCFWNTE